MCLKANGLLIEISLEYKRKGQEGRFFSVYLAPKHL